ncbi:MAG: coproporphyrinogen III oxidase, partial [Phototrophicales bacterium]
MRHIGINRLSLGMQSAHQAELSLFGRWHTFQEVIGAVETARRVGFDNISLDLIYGVPHQTCEMWRATLQAALDLAPDHFSIYALILESGTEITRRIKHKELPMPDEDLTADMYDDATMMLANANYPQYEISSWGKPSEHNLQYWRNLPYLGLGAGAHGYIHRIRTVNVMRPEIYIRRMQSLERDMRFPLTPATMRHEHLDEATDMAETLFMGLRLLNEGVSLSGFKARYGIDLQVRFGAEIQKLIGQNLLVIDNDRLKLTKRARLI